MSLKCPQCGSTNVEECLVFAWSMTCRDCGFSTSDYKPGPANAPFREDSHWKDHPGWPY